MMQKLTANAQIQIQKSMNDVFQAIIEPSKMSNYFIGESSGTLETDKTVQWSFPEFPESFPVTGKEIVADTYISFDWSGGEANQLVEIFLSEGDNNSTVVRIVEHEMENTPDGVEQMKRQTGGWANFLACLKAYLEYGINLRIGAFDYMKQSER
ncbi:SRPBCC domain-containing protein [Sphingobacterium deserti]|uniref:Activator of HSP90 ATPase 1 family protein n=1 Tax=Sphingobacterium deserti TaxID=1229276 RepID=A0A0B8T358_9SPHI|nr:SRPBCC domain-containing protein [Sphingobacterium deserti]KGE13418.1 activator of HSP90 ATPase 1 family protein [Sphingobacterium deserti]